MRFTFLTFFAVAVTALCVAAAPAPEATAMGISPRNTTLEARTYDLGDWSDILCELLPSYPGCSSSSSSSKTTTAKGSATTSTSTAGWFTDQCTTISGTYNPLGVFGWNCFGIQYDFGCVCLSTLPSFCSSNGLSSSIESWIKGLLSSCATYAYPSGSSPTCTGSGSYTCPGSGGSTVSANKDGTCPSATASCGKGYCLQSDGTCCPSGTTSMNGVCCAKTCSGSKNGKCTQKTTCSSTQTLSNGLCCSSGMTGYTTCCCPSGQIEDTSNPGTCICTDTQKVCGSKDNTQCVARCDSGYTYLTSGSKGACCPADSTINSSGVCVCSTGGYKLSGTQTSTGGTTCKNTCTSSQTWKTSMCCRTDMIQSGSSCVCPSGTSDNGTACTVPCTSQQYLNTQGTCTNYCGSGYTWTTSSSATNGGLCCTSSNPKACSTVCCKTTEEESNGHCCAIGSTWNSHSKSCMAPSGSKKKRSTDGMFGISQQIIQASDNLDLNLDLNLCPARMSACPINPLEPTGQYECLDAMTDIMSCGGCASLGKGIDCSTIPGSRFTGCEAGKCQIYSCRPGWKQVNGTACVRNLSTKF